MLDHKLAAYPDLSPRARRIIGDKPTYWEYLLTEDLLQTKLKAVSRRLSDLRRGLYALPYRQFTAEEYLGWQSIMLSTLTGQTNAISLLVNEEFSKAWGSPGEPGSEDEIYRVCSLLAEACSRVLEWEEQVRFTDVPVAVAVEEMRPLLLSVADQIIPEVMRIPDWIAGLLKDPELHGSHVLDLAFTLPRNWEIDFEAARVRVARAMQWE